MHTGRGILRISTAIIILLIGFVLIFLTALIPFKFRRVHVSLWIVVFLARLFNLLFNVRVHCTDVEMVHGHEGFIFMNHMSYLEPLAMLSLTPVRFLAAVEVRLRPVVGWMAAQIGTIFVRREDKDSRAAARDSIVEVLKKDQYPPLIVFPEGRLGLGDRVNPFRYGIFESATQNSVPYLLCAVQFSRPDIALWRGGLGEQLGSAVWRLARARGKVYVDIFPLEVVQPTPEDDARQLARSARNAVARKLGLLAHKST